MKPDQSAIGLLLHGLSVDERQELIDIADYLSEHSQSGQPMPESTVSRVINQASPAVREKLMRLTEALETPRFEPFTPKRTVADRAGEFGLDPAAAELVKGTLDDEAVAAGLQRRLGTDASENYNQPDKPLTLKEQLQAAVDLHHGRK